MIQPAWAEIDTVLLDMDGTLLDLYYDNHFWREYVPQKYAERHGLPLAQARSECVRRYDAKAGTLDWYCIDYWSEALALDIAALKEELAHLIAIHPDVPDFLTAARAAGKRVVLVTNAHQKSLNLKMQRTGLAAHFDAIHSAHTYGLAKEQPEFWLRLAAAEPFDARRTLLIDDSLSVLRSARHYGIAHLYGIARPDTRQERRQSDEFPLLERFSDLMPVL